MIHSRCAGRPHQEHPAASMNGIDGQMLGVSQKQIRTFLTLHPCSQNAPMLHQWGNTARDWRRYQIGTMVTILAGLGGWGLSCLQCKQSRGAAKPHQILEAYPGHKQGTAAAWTDRVVGWSRSCLSFEVLTDISTMPQNGGVSYEEAMGKPAAILPDGSIIRCAHSFPLLGSSGICMLHRCSALAINLLLAFRRLYLYLHLLPCPSCMYYASGPTWLRTELG